MFFDINAMYPSVFREDMPCGRGFEWTDNGGYFTKTLMTTKKSHWKASNGLASWSVTRDSSIVGVTVVRLFADGIQTKSRSENMRLMATARLTMLNTL